MGGRTRVLFGFLVVLVVGVQLLSIKPVHAAATEGSGFTCTFFAFVLKPFGYCGQEFAFTSEQPVENRTFDITSVVERGLVAGESTDVAVAVSSNAGIGYNDARDIAENVFEQNIHSAQTQSALMVALSMLVNRSSLSAVYAEIEDLRNDVSRGLSITRSDLRGSGSGSTVDVSVNGTLTSPTLGGTITLSGLPTNALLFTDSAGTLNALTSLGVDDSGNLLVGTTTAHEQLTVASPLYLADAIPGTTTNRLYSIAGSLYWNGSIVSASSSANWSASAGNVYRPTGSVGVGTSSPMAELSVVGDIALTGGLFDSNASLGINGYILQTDGTNISWVATNTLGLAADLSGSSIQDLGDIAAITEDFGDLLYWNGSAWADIATSALAINTDDLIEGSNLFYTNARVNSLINGSTTILTSNTEVGLETFLSDASNVFTNNDVIGDANIADTITASNYLALSDWYATTTDGLAEGSTNRYYATSLFASDLAGTTTDALTEGASNLYFTNARVASYISGSSTISRLGQSIDESELNISGSPTDGYVLQASSTAGGGFVWVATSSLGITGGGGGVSDFTDLGDTPGSYATGDIFYAASSSALVRLSAGGDGTVLKISGGVPTWGADLGGSGGSGLWASSTNNLLVYPADTADVVVIGGSATTTTGYDLEVIGNTLTSGIVATEATTTGFTINNERFTDLTGTGLVNTAGTLSVANLASSTFNTASTFASGFVLQASSTASGGMAWVATSSLGVPAGTVTSVGATVPTGWTISGSPITDSGTLAFSYDTGYGAVLTASTTAWNTFYDTPSTQITAGTGLSWAGNTLNAEVQSTDLANYFLLSDWYATTTDGLAEGSTNRYYATSLFASDLAGTTTDALTEGASSLYFTNARVASYINSSSTLLTNNTEAALESFLTDATNVFTNNDVIGDANIADTITVSNYLALTDWYATTTDALGEGSTNLYWTNSRFDTRLSATSSLPNIVTLSGLSEVGTIATGTWNGDAVTAAYGGTGQTSYTVGDVLYASGATTLSRLVAGGDGTVLKISGGVPTWGTDLSGGGASAWATSSNGLSIYPSDTTDVVIVGASATSTTGFVFEVSGNALVSGIQSTHATTTNLTVNSERFTDLTGDGLQNSGTALAVNCTDLEGNGIQCSSSNFAIDFTEFDTDSITEGSTNFWGKWGDNFGKLYYAPAGNDYVGIGDTDADYTLEVAAVNGSGYFALSSAAGNDGDIFEVDGSGNIGINDNSPTFKLDVNGTFRSTGLATFDAGINVNSETFTDLTGSGLFNSGGILTVGNIATSSLDIAGTYLSGYILQASTTASGGYAWVATSSLGFVDTTLSVGSDNQIPFVNAGGTDLEYASTFVFDGINLGIGTTSPASTLDVWGDLRAGTNAAPTLFVDASSQEVGIGTNNPEQRLHVSGGNILLENNRYFYIDDQAGIGRTAMYVNTFDDFHVGSTGYDDLYLEVGGHNSAVVIKDGTGFVGIGDFTGDAHLEVSANGGSSGAAFMVSSNDDNDGDLFIINEDGTVGIGTSSPASKLDVWGDFQIATSGASVLFADATSEEVGIGTSNPEERLHVSGGNILLENNQYFYIDDAGGIGRTAMYVNTFDNFYLGSTAYDDLTLQVGGQNSAMVIKDSTGFVGISDFSGDAHLEVSASGGSGGAVFMASSDDDSDGDLVIVNEDGTVGIGTTSPASLLDVWGNFQVGTGTLPALLVDTEKSQVAIGTTTAWGAAGIGLYLEDTTFAIRNSNASNHNMSWSVGATGIGNINFTSSIAFIDTGVNVLAMSDGFGAEFNSSGSASQDFRVRSDTLNDLFFADAGTERVGVATDTPAYTLTVDGDIMGAGALYDNNYSAGTNGQILQTTGSGFNWVATSSLGFNESLWTQNASDIYYTTGSVGIGTSSPASLLDVWGDFRVGTGSTPILLADTAANQLMFGTTTPYNTGGVYFENTDLYFRDTTSAHVPSITVNSSGFLELNAVSGNAVIANTSSGETLRAAGNGVFVNLFGSPTIDFDINGDTDTSLFIADASSDRIGIGTSTPSHKLSVAGDTYITGSLIDNVGTAGTNGQILQTTGSGFNWVATSSLGFNESLWDQNGANINYTAGNVAVGTTSTAYKLDVWGAGRFTRNDNNHFSQSALALYRERADNTDPNANFGVGLTYTLEGATDDSAVTAGGISVNWETDQTNDTTARDSYMSFYTMQDNTEQFDAMVLTSNGRLGIGTTSPSSKLDIWGGLTVGTSSTPTLTVNPGNGFVGVNAAAPSGSQSYSFTANGGIYLTGGGLEVAGSNKIFGTNTGTDTGLSFPASNTILLESSNNDLMRMSNASGIIVNGENAAAQDFRIEADIIDDLFFADVGAQFIGVATDTPGYTLTVAGDIMATGALYDNNYSAGTNGMVLQSTGTGFTWVATSSLGFTSPITGTEGYTITFDSSGAQTATSSLFVAANNSIGVGTTTPQSPLHVIGNTRIDGLLAFGGNSASDPGIQSNGSGGLELRTADDSGFVNVIGSSYYIGSYSRYLSNNGLVVDNAGGFEFDNSNASGSFRWDINSSEKMRLNSSGYLGIGTSSPASTLDVWGNVRVGTSSQATLFVDAATTNVGVQQLNPQVALHIGSTSVADSTSLLRLEDTNSTCNFNADSGSPSCGSDRTLKKDIEIIEDELNRLVELEPSSWLWKTDTNGASRQFGFIAQDVEKQFPELVTESLWIDGTTRKFLNTGGLMPYVVGAVKEQQETLEELMIHGTSERGTSSPFYMLFDGEEDTIWEKMVSLAQGFGDGILELAGLQTVELYARDIEAETITTEELCVGETCISETDLIQLLNGQTSNSNQSETPVGSSNSGSGNSSNSDVNDSSSNTTGDTGSGSTTTSTSTESVTAPDTIATTTDEIDTSDITEDDTSTSTDTTNDTEEETVNESNDSTETTAEITDESEDAIDHVTEPDTEEETPDPVTESDESQDEEIS